MASMHMNRTAVVLDHNFVSPNKKLCINWLYLHAAGMLLLCYGERLVEI